MKSFQSIVVVFLMLFSHLSSHSGILWFSHIMTSYFPFPLPNGASYRPFLPDKTHSNHSWHLIRFTCSNVSVYVLPPAPVPSYHANKTSPRLLPGIELKRHLISNDLCRVSLCSQYLPLNAETPLMRKHTAFPDKKQRLPVHSCSG